MPKNNKIKETKKAPTFDELASLNRDRWLYEWSQQRSIHRWLEETVGFANDAAKEQLDDWRVSMFWIRLYGVLHDLRVHWEKVVSRRRAAGLDTACFDELIAATTRTNEALSEAQRLCLEYRRDWTVHPVLNDFRVSQKPDGSIRHQRPAKLLNRRPTTIDEYDAVLTKMVQDQDHRDNARDMARAVVQPLIALYELVRQVYPLVPLASFRDVEAT